MTSSHDPNTNNVTNTGLIRAANSQSRALLGILMPLGPVGYWTTIAGGTH
jgi:hypothetical protein